MNFTIQEPAGWKTGDWHSAKMPSFYFWKGNEYQNPIDLHINIGTIILNCGLLKEIQSADEEEDVKDPLRKRLKKKGKKRKKKKAKMAKRGKKAFAKMKVINWNFCLS